MAKNALFSLAGFSLICVPGAAVGQYVGPWDLGTSLTTPTMIDNAINEAVSESLSSEPAQQDYPGNALQAPALSNTTVPDGSFSYRYSSERTRANLRNFIARTPGPAARVELQQMFASQPGFMEEIRASIAPFGLDSHNVADAFAMWWINAWQVANKQDETPDRGTVVMVKQQVYAAFAATPDFAKTTDAERQEFAESLLIQAAMLSSAFEQMKGDPKQLDQLAQAARKGAEASGIDLSKMTLTQNGFVPRKGANAGDAVGAGEDMVRNARSNGEAETSSLGLALAAGAGLGATLLGGFALMRRG
jgi:hypothetical protein